MLSKFLKVLSLSLIANVALAEKVISSLPFVADQPGEIYLLSQDLVSSGDKAITIAADNVTIDGQNHTIVFADQEAGYGIYVDTNVTALRIRNIRLVQGSYEPQASERAIAIYRNGSISGLEVYDSHIEISKSGAASGALGYGISVVNNVRRSTNNVIRDNTIVLDGTSGARGIDFQSSSKVAFLAEISRNDITIKNQTSRPAGYPRAISLSIMGDPDAPEELRIIDNTISLEASNDTIQGISLWQTDHVVITGNTINSAANHARALLVDGESDNNYVMKNNITLSSSHDTSDATAGIRVRFGSDHNIVFDNSVNASNGLNSFPLRLGDNDQFGHLEGNIVLNNSLSSQSRVVSIETGSNIQLYGNSLSALDDAHHIYFYCNGEGNCDNLRFDSNTYSGLTKKIRFTGAQGSVGVTNSVFCEPELLVDFFDIGTGEHSYTFQSAACNPVSPSVEHKGVTKSVSGLVSELEALEALVRELTEANNLNPPKSPLGFSGSLL